MKGIIPTTVYCPFCMEPLWHASQININADYRDMLHPDNKCPMSKKKFKAHLPTVELEEIPPDPQDKLDQIERDLRLQKIKHEMGGLMRGDPK